MNKQDEKLIEGVDYGYKDKKTYFWINPQRCPECGNDEFRVTSISVSDCKMKFDEKGNFQLMVEPTDIEIEEYECPGCCSNYSVEDMRDYDVTKIELVK